MNFRCTKPVFGKNNIIRPLLTYLKQDYYFRKSLFYNSIDMPIKDLIKSGLNFFHLDVTKNLKYDRLSKKIMSLIISNNSNCIDIGCHKGEILDLIIELAPNGKHFAFEPIPELYRNLKTNFSKVEIFPFALSDENNKTIFHYVKNAPAYSGIKKRKYAIKNPDIEKIEVDVKKLDEVIPENVNISFIKIDVEGAELGVLKGAKKLLSKNKPFIIFEFGLGASDYYNTQPEDIYNLLVTEIGLQISTLQDWLKKKNSLSSAEFEKCFNTNCEYYFIAHP